MSTAIAVKKKRKGFKCRIFKNETQSEIAFKGFKKGLVCRGFVFNKNDVNSIDGKITLCDRGFHACTVPNDVYNHYGSCDENVYAVVQQWGNIHRRGDKQASQHLRIIRMIPKDKFNKLACLARELRDKRFTKKQINQVIRIQLGV